MDVLEQIKEWLTYSIQVYKKQNNKIYETYQEVLDKINSYQQGNEGFINNHCKSCDKDFKMLFRTEICNECLLDVIY